jgi:hypothetical protein
MTDPDQDAKKQAQERLASPSTPKDKPRHGPPATKAEHAAARRADKTVIKRMRKR